jgi:putative addiction module CopG family antidote
LVFDESIHAEYTYMVKSEGAIMVVSIPPDIESYVQEAIAAGRFESPEQAFREAFQLLQDQDRQRESLRTEVKRGFDQFDQGQGIELDEAGLRELFDDIQARGEARYERRKADP